MDCTGRLKRFWTRVTLHRLPGGVHQGNELTRNSSSQLAVALWTDPGLMSGIDTRELISALKKKKKKTQAWNDLSNLLSKSSSARKKPPPTTHVATFDCRNRDLSAGLQTLSKSDAQLVYSGTTVYWFPVLEKKHA